MLLSTTLQVSASVFGQYLSWVNIPKLVAKGILALTSNKYVFLMLCNVVLLILGMFLEGGAALMITTPLLLPVAQKLGVDTIHFGLVMIVNIMIGGITPPFGSMMFTTCGITKCPISEFLKEVWPFILVCQHNVCSELLRCIFIYIKVHETDNINRCEMIIPLSF